MSLRAPRVRAGASAGGLIICDHEALPFRRLIGGMDRIWIPRTAVKPSIQTILIFWIEPLHYWIDKDDRLN